MNGRKRFDAIDMLQQAMGLPTPEGFAVITKEFAKFLADELTRLYEVEEGALPSEGGGPPVDGDVMAPTDIARNDVLIVEDGRIIGIRRNGMIVFREKRTGGGAASLANLDARMSAE